MSLTDMQLRDLYTNEHFPRASRYDWRWVAVNDMGPNALYLAESLSEVMDLTPDMRVLDMGCGRAMSSIFLAKEFGVQVWATDLWTPATENLERIREAGLEDQVFPIHAEAHALPYAEGFFDAIVSYDSYQYYGTDVHYLESSMLKLLKPGGRIGIVSPASPTDIPSPRPTMLAAETMWYWMNSVSWWRDLWERCPGLVVEVAEPMPHGWDMWVRWNLFEEAAQLHSRPWSAEEDRRLLTEQDRDLKADGGKHIGFVRMVGRREG
jgi:SAM-dependent methyltransferase